MMTKLANLRRIFQLAENDPSGEAIAELLHHFRPEVLRVIDQSAAEVAIRPSDLDEKLKFIAQIGDPSARMAAAHINKIFIRAQKKHLHYLSEIRSELEAAFNSLDVDGKVDTLTHETLRHYSVVNAYLAR